MGVIERELQSVARGRGARDAWNLARDDFRVSVVIPARNEARNLEEILPLIDSRFEVVLVDGSSSDDTIEVVRSMRSDAVIVRQTGKGKGDALQQGFAAATGDVIVMLDADGSADPAEIPRFVSALVAGADFAKGSRNLPGGGSTDITRFRSTGNRYLTWLVNSLFGTSYTDLCYGYNAFWRHCLPAMAVDCAGFEVETLINIRISQAGLRVAEVPSFELDRIHGESNLRPVRDGLRIKRTIFRERYGRARGTHESVGGDGHVDGERWRQMQSWSTSAANQADTAPRG